MQESSLLETYNTVSAFSRSVTTLLHFLAGFSKPFKTSVYPIGGAACMPAVNGKENMDISWPSVCQTWEFGSAGKHQSCAPSSTFQESCC